MAIVPAPHIGLMKGVFASHPLSLTSPAANTSLIEEVFTADLPRTIAHDLDAARPVLLLLDKLAGAPEHQT